MMPTFNLIKTKYYRFQNCFFAILIFLTLFITINYLHQNDGSIIIDGPTELLFKPDRKEVDGNKVIMILNHGETGKVIGVTYSKDFKFYKIELNNGIAGYVMYGDDFRIIQNN